MSERKTPILLRRGPLSGDINALYRYRHRTLKTTGQVIIEASGKQNVTADFDALVLETLLGDDCPNITATLDGAAGAMALHPRELEELGRLRERLVTLIKRHNAGPHVKGASDD